MQKDLVRRLLEKMGSEAIKRLRANINKDNTRASNALHDSMYYKIVKTTIDIYMARYAKSVDEGLNPRQGKPSSYFVRKIKGWMQSKGIRGRLKNRSGKEDINKSARAIAEAIYERGTIKRFGYKGSNFIDRAINNIENEFDNDILTAFSSEIDKELEKIK
jgi:hypothetical protein